MGCKSSKTRGRRGGRNVDMRPPHQRGRAKNDDAVAIQPYVASKELEQHYRRHSAVCAQQLQSEYTTQSYFTCTPTTKLIGKGILATVFLAEMTVTTQCTRKEGGGAEASRDGRKVTDGGSDAGGAGGSEAVVPGAGPRSPRQGSRGGGAARPSAGHPLAPPTPTLTTPSSAYFTDERSDSPGRVAGSTRADRGRGKSIESTTTTIVKRYPIVAKEYPLTGPNPQVTLQRLRDEALRYRRLTFSPRLLKIFLLEDATDCTSLQRDAEQRLPPLQPQGDADAPDSGGPSPNSATLRPARRRSSSRQLSVPSFVPQRVRIYSEFGHRGTLKQVQDIVTPNVYGKMYLHELSIRCFLHEALVALAYLHENQVVYQDLNPDHIYIAHPITAIYRTAFPAYISDLPVCRFASIPKKRMLKVMEFMDPDEMRRERRAAMRDRRRIRMARQGPDPEYEDEDEEGSDDSSESDESEQRALDEAAHHAADEELQYGSMVSPLRGNRTDHLATPAYELKSPEWLHAAWGTSDEAHPASLQAIPSAGCYAHLVKSGAFDVPASGIEANQQHSLSPLQDAKLEDVFHAGDLDIGFDSEDDLLGNGYLYGDDAEDMPSPSLVYGSPGLFRMDVPRPPRDGARGRSSVVLRPLVSPVPPAPFSTSLPNTSITAANAVGVGESDAGEAGSPQSGLADHPPAPASGGSPVARKRLCRSRPLIKLSNYGRLRSILFEAERNPPAYKLASVTHLAPEVIESSKFTTASDIYAFAMTFVQLATPGGVLFEDLQRCTWERTAKKSRDVHDSLEERVAAIVEDDDAFGAALMKELERHYATSPTPVEIPAHLSSRCRALLAKCLSRAPEKRPTAVELLRDGYFLFGSWVESAVADGEMEAPWEPTDFSAAAQATGLRKVPLRVLAPRHRAAETSATTVAKPAAAAATSSPTSKKVRKSPPAQAAAGGAKHRDPAAS